MVSAVSVSENLLTREKSQALKKRAGNFKNDCGGLSGNLARKGEHSE
jgi:hypothetical protein